jgi:hypothetical protein
MTKTRVFIAGLAQVDIAASGELDATRASAHEGITCGYCGLKKDCANLSTATVTDLGAKESSPTATG